MNSKIGSKLNFIFLAVVVVLILLGNKAYDYEISSYNIDSGDTSWMLVSSAFVLLMTPGLAFSIFKENVINYAAESSFNSGASVESISSRFLSTNSI